MHQGGQVFCLRSSSHPSEVLQRAQLTCLTVTIWPVCGNCQQGLFLDIVVRVTQSERHGSRSRAPSVVCSWASATKDAQRCPDDKAQDILPALCKNWVIGIDSADCRYRATFMHQGGQVFCLRSSSHPSEVLQRAHLTCLTVTIWPVCGNCQQGLFLDIVLRARGTAVAHVLPPSCARGLVRRKVPSAAQTTRLKTFYRRFARIG